MDTTWQSQLVPYVVMQQTLKYKYKYISTSTTSLDITYNDKQGHNERHKMENLNF